MRYIEYVSIQNLKPNPRNARTHSRKQIGQIAESFRRFGFNGTIVINRDYVILAGHGRVEAAKLAGLSTVPCIRVSHLTESQERAFSLADNKIAANAGWDRRVVSDELQDLLVLLPSSEEPLDISVTGFEAAEIDGLLIDLADRDADPTDEEDCEIEEQPVSRFGDVWVLGDHSLICADARDSASYQQLLGGKLADLAVFDPPFNIPVSRISGRGRRKHGEFVVASGELTRPQFLDFLVTALIRHADACRPGALIYVAMDWRGIETLCAAGRVAGLELLNICVWNKTGAGQGSFYRSQHELVAVFHKTGAAPRNNIALGRYGRSRSNVWTYAAPNRFKGPEELVSQHPTPKPTAMIAEILKDASARGDVVLDGFAGSGTIFLAAEKVGRRATGIEFEPRYCDLSIRRWERFTGRDAILRGSSHTFTETMQERNVVEPRRRSEEA